MIRKYLFTLCVCACVYQFPYASFAENCENSQDFSQIEDLGIKSFYVEKDDKKTIQYMTEAIECAKLLDKKEWLLKSYDLRGSAYVNQQMYDKAIDDYSRIIEITPNKAEGYIKRGRVFCQMNEPDKAIADFNKAEEIDPSSLYTNSPRADAHIMKGEYEKAISDYTIAILHNENREGNYKWRGDAYLLQKMYDKAIADYTISIKLDPEFALAFLMRGTSFFAKGNYNEALEDLNKAIELEPGMDDWGDEKGLVFFLRGASHFRKSAYSKALEDFSFAIKKNPDIIDAYNGRGWAYFNLQQFENAIKDFEHLIAVDKTEHKKDAYCGLALSYYKAGDKNKAFEAYKKAVELDARYAGKINEIMEKEGYYYTEGELKTINELLKEMGY